MPYLKKLALTTRAAVVCCALVGWGAQANPAFTVEHWTTIRPAVVQAESIGSWVASTIRIKNACRPIVFAASEDDEVRKRSGPQGKAFANLQKLCADFTQADYSPLWEREVRRKAAAQSDQQWMAISAFLQAYRSPSSLSSHAKAELFSKVFALRDPDVLEEIGYRPFVYTGQKEAFIYYDGKRHSMSDDPEIIYAFQLIPCHFGNKCDANDLTVVVECATVGACFDSRRELVEFKARSAGKDFQKVSALAESMARHIKLVDYSRFLMN